ncbi:hypothetical protein [Spirosoma fluminis]
MSEVKITPIEGGTNIFNAQLSPAVDVRKLGEVFWKKYNIGLPSAKADGYMKLLVNDSLLNRTNDQLLTAFEDAFSFAKK